MAYWNMDVMMSHHSKIQMNMELEVNSLSTDDITHMFTLEIRGECSLCIYILHIDVGHFQKHMFLWMTWS